MLEGQCPAITLGSFALGSPWPPAAIMDLSGRAMLGCAITTSKLGEELRKALACWHPPAASAEGSVELTQTHPGDSERRPQPSGLLILPQPGRCHLRMGSITMSSWHFGVFFITQDVTLRWVPSPGMSPQLGSGPRTQHPWELPTLTIPNKWLPG